METVLASVIAVAGTLLGSALTYVFQQRASKQAQAMARSELFVQEQLAAWSSFLGALMEYRRNLYFRWRLAEEQALEERRAEERAETYRLRSAADQALARARLVTPQSELFVLAGEALKACWLLRRARDRQDLTERRDEVERVHNRLATAVAEHLSASSSQ